MVNRTTLWRHLYPICCIYDLSRSNMLFAFFFFFSLPRWFSVQMPVNKTIIGWRTILTLSPKT